MRLAQVLATLSAHRPELSRFKIRSLSLFGSVARDAALPGSDVDVLVAFESPPAFATFMQLKFFLEDLLGTKVDLVTENGLRDAVRANVEREAIRVA